MAEGTVTLNVGGTLYTTSLLTLTSQADSMLASMFSGRFEKTTKDKDGNYFIDRDGRYFGYILNFLRDSDLTLPEDFKAFKLLIKEAEFYQITALIKAIHSYREEHHGSILEIREYRQVVASTGNDKVRCSIRSNDKSLIPVEMMRLQPQLRNSSAARLKFGAIAMKNGYKFICSNSFSVGKSKGTIERYYLSLYNIKPSTSFTTKLKNYSEISEDEK